MDEKFRAELLELVKESVVDILVQQELLTPEDLAGLTVDDYRKLEVPLGSARKLAAKYSPKVEAPVASGETGTVVSTDVLPVVPDDEPFLQLLKVGGMLKVEPVDVMSAMRAALAARLGLYELPDILLDKIESFAQEQGEPAGEAFYGLQKLIAQRGYGEVLSALGVSGNFVSERRKKEMLRRLNENMWPALKGFYDQLVAWTDVWAKGMANPGMALGLLAIAQVGSGSGMVLPPGMMQPPDTAGLRDAAEAVNDRINGVFAGTGIPVARAMAFDAVRIREILNNPTLPAATGSTTRDQMLKSLGVSVGADYVRLEKDIVRFALALMEFPKVGAGQAEWSYLGAMLQLGSAIPWEKLEGSVATIVSRRKGSGGRPEVEEEDGRVRHY